MNQAARDAAKLRCNAALFRRVSLRVLPVFAIRVPSAVRKLLVFGCLLPLLLIAAAGAYVCHLAAWKPSPAALPPPPPPATAYAARAKIEAVTRQVRRIRRAPRHHATRRFHLALKEDEI